MSCGLWGLIQSRPPIPATTYGTLERRARSRAFSASVPSRVTLMLAAGRRRACSRAVRTIDRGPVRALTEPSALAEAERRRQGRRVYYLSMSSGAGVDIKYLSNHGPVQLQDVLFTVKRTIRRNLWYVYDRHTAHHVRTQTPQQTPQSRAHPTNGR